MSLCRRIVHARALRSAGGVTSGCVAPRALFTTASLELSDSAQPLNVVRARLQCAVQVRLCDPQTPLPSNHVYERLVNPSRLVEEFNFSKTTKRLARQHAALHFLRRHNVLLHSLLFYVPATSTWNTTPEFSRVALLGESIMRAEVRARLLALLPDIPCATYTATTEALLSQRAIVTLYDALGMEGIVGAKPPPRQVAPSPKGSRKRTSIELPRVAKKITPSVEEKCQMLYAVIGEMHWFVARTKATDRTHNNALFPPSDVLIMHVLCAHLLECLPAELIFRELEPIIQSIRAVWVNEPMSVPSQLRLRPRTIAALSLSASPHAPTEEELAARQAVHGNTGAVGLLPLSVAANGNYVKSFMQPKCSHAHFDGPWYAILPADRRGAAPALAAKPSAATRGGAAADRALWNDHRRWELAHPETFSSGPAVA